MKPLILSFVLSTLFIQDALAQDKYEKEYSIRRQAVPQKALDFIDAVGFTEKIKWYKEQGLTTSTVEAKTRRDGSRYSIEFDSTGSIEDVECKMKWEEIPMPTRSVISSFLDSMYQKKKIYKVQVQFTGTSEELLKKLTESKPIDTVNTKYEIVLKGKTEEQYEMVEYLFSETGQTERKSRIVLKNTDNLEY